MLVLAGSAVGSGAGPAAAIELPTPAGQRAIDLALLAEVGARADRRLVSVVPGPVVNTEVVLVDLAGSGAPEQVMLEQRITLTGTGDYQVRERGPARAAQPLGDEPPPVTKFGAVVWQGFSPGARELAARLTLDPVLESARLPLSITTSYAGKPLGEGGLIPGPGQVVVRLENRTAQPATLPTAADADARVVAAALDAARTAASSGIGTGRRLPAAGSGLPAQVATLGDAQVSTQSGVPLRVTGTVRVLGPGAVPAAPTESGNPGQPAGDPALGSVSGPATTAVAGGADLAGTLPPGASAELLVQVTGPAVLSLQLTAVATLDARTLAPPGGARSWAAWAASNPDLAARRAALDLLVQIAATGARASSYSPYLGADLPGSGTTEFRYSFAVPDRPAMVVAALEPRPGPIAAAALAVLLLATGGVAVWRRS